jgi:phage gp46-like protein
MATVKAIKYGMKGDEVSNLQTSLKNAGYNIDVDGSFGPQTLAAVKQYQQKNGLDVDGMVGPQTQAALFGGNTNKPAEKTQGAAAPQAKPATSAPSTATGTTPNVLPTPNDSGSAPASAKINYPESFSYDNFSYGDFSYGDYQESETVMQAQAALNAALAAQPGAYQSKWQGQIDEMIGRILNREKFTYDINSDALYQQYADQYKNLGKLAMQDTMGQAAAMTGGYGNSYAQSVGQQAYQGYLSQLNEMIPELYGMALDQYNREGQEMYNQYGLLSDQEAQEYGRYQDAYNKWLADRDYYTGRYDSERDYDYSKYIDDRNYEYGKYVDDRNYEYGKYSDDRNQAYSEYLDAVQQAQWGAQFDETVKQNAIGNQQWQQSFGENVKQNAIGNQQWETSRQDKLSSEAKAYAREEVMAVLESGGTVSDAQLAAAGMSKEAANALSAAYQKAASGKSGSGASESGDGASYVTDSGKIANWSEAVLEADTEEEALRYVERLEQLDPTLADSLYEEWLREHSAGHGITDTTVATPSRGSSSGSGGRGLAGFNAVIKY